MNCPRCGTPLDGDPLSDKIPQYCEPCLAEVTAEDARADITRIRDQQWQKICPIAYLSTERARLPLADRSDRALAWRYGQTGLNLWGYPDTGKTRTALLVLKASHYAGRRVRFLAAGAFGRLCDDRRATADAFSSLARCHLLLLDDMDKMILTPRQESLLFTLIDRRVSHHLPTIITHNSTAELLEYHFKCVGQALVRRLREFFQAIHFPER